MKPTPHFVFADEPQYGGPESREHAAHLLRAWRKHPGRYNMARLAPNVYACTCGLARAILSTGRPR